MVLLERIVSEYTYNNVVIGVFRDLEVAKKNRLLYIEECKIEDRWGQQAYRKVNLTEDVTIKEVPKKVLNGNTDFSEKAYVVNFFFEGFGQTTRITKKIFPTHEAAQKYIKKKESQEPEIEPSWYTVEEMIIDDADAYLHKLKNGLSHD